MRVHWRVLGRVRSEQMFAARGPRHCREGASRGAGGGENISWGQEHPMSSCWNPREQPQDMRNLSSCSGAGRLEKVHSMHSWASSAWSLTYLVCFTPGFSTPSATPCQLGSYPPCIRTRHRTLATSKAGQRDATGPDWDGMDWFAPPSGVDCLE